MGKIGAVTITEVYSPVSRLELVDKAAWPDLIHKKANFAASALNEDLAIALEILDEFEKTPGVELCRDGSSRLSQISGSC
jgi:hypothetical protein